MQYILTYFDDSRGLLFRYIFRHSWKMAMGMERKSSLTL